jgi:hypothetical protein
VPSTRARAIVIDASSDPPFDPSAEYFRDHQLERPNLKITVGTPNEPVLVGTGGAAAALAAAARAAARAAEMPRPTTAAAARRRPEMPVTAASACWRSSRRSARPSVADGARADAGKRP